MGRVAAAVVTLIGALFTATMLVFLLAGAANSSPEQWRLIQFLLACSGTVGLAAIVGAVWAVRAGRAGLAALVGAAPVALGMALIFLMFALEL